LDKITTQINIAPVDYPMVTHMLPQQIEVLDGSVEEILLTFDKRRVRGSKLDEGRWESNKNAIETFIDRELKEKFTNSRIIVDPVNYDLEMRKSVGSYFFGIPMDFPLKDFRGGPFYAYYYGLCRASNDFVFHLDADMMLVGDAGS
jgi:hypothetical protein